VFHFLEQHLLLAEQFLGAVEQILLFAFDQAALGDVAESQEDGRIGTVVVNHLAGIEQHRLAAKTGEIMFDLEPVHRGPFGDDRFEQQPERRNVPLAVPQIVEQAAVGLFGIDLEGRVKGAARGEHPKLPVEHQEGFGDSIDDRLGEDLRVEDVVGRTQHVPAGFFLLRGDGWKTPAPCGRP